MDDKKKKEEMKMAKESEKKGKSDGNVATAKSIDKKKKK